jgi:hypothetical protein
VKKFPGLIVLFLMAFLFSSSVAAFGVCPDNGLSGLAFIESKIVMSKGEVTARGRETTADFYSTGFIQSESLLLSSNNIEAGYGSRNREYNFIHEIGLDTVIRIRLPPEGFTA